MEKVNQQGTLAGVTRLITRDAIMIHGVSFRNHPISAIHLNFSSASFVTTTDLGSSGYARVNYATGLFVAVTPTGKILTSPDGSVWTQRTLPAATSRLEDVFHDGTRFVVVGHTVTGSNPARSTVLHSTGGGGPNDRSPGFFLQRPPTSRL